MKSLAMPVLMLAFAGCDGRSVGGATIASERAAPSPSLTHKRALEILERRPAGARLETLDLAGYSFHRDIGIGSGLHMIVVSKNLGGGLLLFSADGRHVATRSTNEITTVLLIDVDEDGTSELMTEEVDGRGTGVLEKAFRLYRVRDQGIDEVWHGESYVRHAPDESRTKVDRAFVRFDPGGAGKNARLTHLVETADGQRREMSFEWRNNAMTQAP